MLSFQNISVKSVVVLLGVTFLGQAAYAEPTLSKSSFVDIEPAMSDCEQNIAHVKVSQVVYENVSDIIAGFRIARPSPNELYRLYRIKRSAYKKIPNSTLSHLGDLIHNGADLVIAYQICGSGGSVYVRDIYKASIFNLPTTAVK